jgi:predicted nucleic acid-binding Zn ribbon protein
MAVRNIQRRQKLTFKRAPQTPAAPPLINNKKKMREPTLLGTLVQEQIQKLGLGKKILESQAVLIYKDVVGQKIAAISEAVDLRGGKLFVQVHSPAWKEELMFTRHLIAEKINKELGVEVVKQVFLL